MGLERDLERMRELRPTGLQAWALKRGWEEPRGSVFSSPEELLLSHGSVFCSASSDVVTLTSEEESVRVSLDLSLTHGLRLVQGVARASDTSSWRIHSWCVDHENNVIDPSWLSGSEYFGIELHPLEVASRYKNRPPLVIMEREYHERSREEIFTEAVKLARGY